jgi:hypothetical protein
MERENRRDIGDGCMPIAKTLLALVLMIILVLLMLSVAVS